MNGDPVARWQELKRLEARLVRRRDEAVGAQAQLLRELREQAGVDSPKAARRLLKKLEWELAAAEAEFARLADEFAAAWHGKLEEI